MRLDAFHVINYILRFFCFNAQIFDKFEIVTNRASHFNGTPRVEVKSASLITTILILKFQSVKHIVIIDEV